MGISKSSQKMIAKALKDNNINLKGKNILTLGVQGIEGSYKTVLKSLKEVEYPFIELDKNDIKLDEDNVYGAGAIHQETFFKTLGFEKIESLDLFENEEPTFIINLNEPIPVELENKYDFIIDGGTIEHCFDIKQVLTNIVKMLKKDGYIIHQAPISGWVNHGFYQFSPTLFLDFYAANSFNILESKAQFGDRFIPILDELMVNFCGNAVLSFFLAQKTCDNNEIKLPIQQLYRVIYGKKQFRCHKNRNKTQYLSLYNINKEIIKSLSNYIKAYHKLIKKSETI